MNKEMILEYLNERTFRQRKIGSLWSSERPIKGKINCLESPMYIFTYNTITCMNGVAWQTVLHFELEPIN